MVNNILLSIAAGLILLGTIYPLIIDALNMGKISVGAPYFETVFLIPTLPLVLAIGVGMHATWRAADGSLLLRRLRWPAAVALILALALPFALYGSNTVLTAVGVAAGGWLVMSSLLDPVARLFGRGPRLTRAMLGMQLAHLGVGLFVLGVTVTSSFGIETDQRVALGETVKAGDYSVTFKSLEPVEGPNYTAVRGEMEVTRNGRPVTVLYPEKRIYRVQRSPMTEAGIDGGWTRDVFVALGEDLGRNAWSVRIQYKPLVRFIWLGCIVMSFGGLLAISDRRYRLARQRATAEAAAAEGAAAS